MTNRYELTLPSATTSSTLLVTFTQGPPRDAFTPRYAGSSAGGAVGSFVGVPVNTRTVGTGDIQISISWDAFSDVDLHVVDPSGEEIW